jgi:hypothetical protein
MIEQIEPGLRLVDEHGAIAEPAAKAPEHALTGPQAHEHGERQPHSSHVLGALCHCIDDQLQAVLRGAGAGGRSQDRGERRQMRERPPPDVVPEKRDRSARKCGDTAQGCAVGRLRASKLPDSG